LSGKLSVFCKEGKPLKRLIDLKEDEMIKMRRKVMAGTLVLMLFAGTLAGCAGEAEPVAELPEEEEEYYEDEDFEEYEDYGDYEEIEEAEEEPEEVEDESKTEKKAEGSGDLTNEEIVELAKKHSKAPVAELDQVMDNGNLYIHLYEDMGDHTATIDWYEIDPKTLKGTNFEGEEVDLSKEVSSKTGSSDSEGDEGEGIDIADGEYVTDDEYEGELSEDGKTMTITTALYEFVNSPSPSYPKQTYVINVSDSCKCVEMHEKTTESSFFDKMDLIRDFLKGVSGLPITLKFKNNELVEIMFTS